MSLNDLHPIRRLRRAQNHLFQSPVPAAKPRKVILYSMDPWQLGVFEQFLHLALHVKGHRPHSVYFDGGLPLCAWENIATPPPPVEVIKRRFEFIYDSFAICARGITSYFDAAAARSHATSVLERLGRSELADLKYRNIQIGRIALRDLCQFTLGAFTLQSPDDEARLRDHLLHAIMSVDFAHDLLIAERPDTVVLVNGKSVMYSYMFEVCRRAGVHLVTWEEGMYFDTSIVLAHDERAIDFPIPETPWRLVQRAAFTRRQREEVVSHFEKWRAQTATSYVYYTAELRDFSRIQKELSLSHSSRIVLLLANIAWDTNALGRDRAFSGMMDWIYHSIDSLADCPNTVVVIRAHPGETNWQFKTRTPIRHLVSQRYGQIPSHVRIVDGASEISSYELARRSDRCAVYTSTMGVELTLAGRRPLICGAPYYSGRGFTNDILSKEQYDRLIRGEGAPVATNAVELLKFMHFVLFRMLKRPEFFVGVHATPQQPQIHIDSFEGWPQSMPIFNEIVDCIVERRSFVERIIEPRPRLQPA